MLATSEFKSAPSSDYFKQKVYQFDTLLEFAIKTYISTINNSIFADLHDTVHSIDLTNKIFELEHVENFKVSQNKLDGTSNCSFNEITFCQSHLFNQEVAFHEMAHFFEHIYSAIKLPSHHISFLATLEYLLDKYDFLNKSNFQFIVKEYNKISGEKIPYIEDFLQITEHNFSDYDTFLQFLTIDQKYSQCKTDKFFRYDSFERIIFETTDHYVTLLTNKNNTKTFQKIIQKKLAFEIKNDKYYDLIISPKFTAYREYDRIHLSTSKHNYTHDAFAISIESEHFDSYLLIDLIEKELNFNSNNEFTVTRQSDKVIVVATYSDSRNSHNLISTLSELFKSKRISYYKTKSKNDFANKSSRINYFMF